MILTPTTALGQTVHTPAPHTVVSAQHLSDAGQADWLEESSESAALPVAAEAVAGLSLLGGVLISLRPKAAKAWA